MVSEAVERLRAAIKTHWALVEKYQRNHKPIEAEFYRLRAVQLEDDLYRKYGERTVGMDDNREPKRQGESRI
jgi:hypothetical protein